MKLLNPDFAGKKLCTSIGYLQVGADGSVEVSEENVIAALKMGGFRPCDPEDNSQNKPKSRQAVQTKKNEKVTSDEDIAPDEEGEEDDEEEGEEVEIPDLADFTAKVAMEMISAEEDADVIEAWLESEAEGRKRASVVKCLEKRLSEVK